LQVLCSAYDLNWLTVLHFPEKEAKSVCSASQKTVDSP
jgi:hypothetical protein